MYINYQKPNIMKKELVEAIKDIRTRITQNEKDF